MIKKKTQIVVPVLLVMTLGANVLGDDIEEARKTFKKCKGASETAIGYDFDKLSFWEKPRCERAKKTVDEFDTAELKRRAIEAQEKLRQMAATDPFAIVAFDRRKCPISLQRSPSTRSIECYIARQMTDHLKKTTVARFVAKPVAESRALMVKVEEACAWQPSSGAPENKRIENEMSATCEFGRQALQERAANLVTALAGDPKRLTEIYNGCVDRVKKESGGKYETLTRHKMLQEDPLCAAADEAASHYSVGAMKIHVNFKSEDYKKPAPTFRLY